MLHSLCPVLHIECSSHFWAIFCASEARTKGLPVTKQKLPCWILDVIVLVYASLWEPSPPPVLGWARCLLVTSVLPPSMFARIYNLDISALQVWSLNCGLIVGVHLTPLEGGFGFYWPEPVSIWAASIVDCCLRISLFLRPVQLPVLPLYRDGS